ncbi:MAG: response regulator [Gammaproteobacteria bacterium]|nr:response regulator [Gammaproteobacteria bacterium]
MAKKTNLSSTEVEYLLMASPLMLFEWVQQGKLHAHLEDGFDTAFSRDDLRYFVQARGLSIGRPDKNRLRVLIVDSDPRITHSLVDLFDTLSETVDATAVHSVYEAGQRLQSGSPDIVLMDLRLSNPESMEMCRRIKSDRATRHVRLITMIDHQDCEQVQRSLMLGAAGCLSKPINHQKLFEAMGLCVELPSRHADARVEDYP